MFSDVPASCATVSCLCLVLVGGKVYKPGVLREFLSKLNLQFSELGNVNCIFTDIYVKGVPFECQSYMY